MAQVAEKTQFVVLVGSKGRVVLPAEVREALGLKEGDPILLRRRQDGSFELVSFRQVAHRARGLLKGLSPGVSLVDELIRERREEARREELE
ncbi:AbrB/MazE/SpoVT family DNA-binding domain-containing protein [Thermus caldifontis]|uniref:AbrB/MazE/SpoVT family DNA-binding domain-containing protein n=1 Tax=Thermus caldifontis TaxID=1930763 RepID=UPI000DF28A51|nr:AbrB/MazE/SpoVT family DNA-binding domain-containing protein [Thermus caldifontis]